MNNEEISIGLEKLIRKGNWIIAYDENIIQLSPIRSSAIVRVIEIDSKGTTTINTNSTSITIRSVVNSPESAKDSILSAIETLIIKEKSILSRLEKTMSDMM
jgi:hypothetical protein